MSSGVPPRPPVTTMWSTRSRSRRTNSAIASISSGHRRDEHDADAERLQPLGEPDRVRVLTSPRDDLVPDRQDRAARRPVSRVATVWTVDAVSYPRRAGHISPAGVQAAKPVRTRRCPATAMPLGRAGRTSQVACPTPDERQPSEEGRFAGTQPPSPPPPLTRRFSHGHQKAGSGHSPWLSLALVSLRRAANGGRAGLPGHDHDRERHGHARREAGADRLALADRDRGSVRDRRRHAGRRRRRPVELPGERAAARSSPASRRTSRRSPGYKPDLVVVSRRPRRSSPRRSASCSIPRARSSRRRRTSPARTRRSTQLGEATGHRAGGRSARGEA